VGRVVRNLPSVVDILIDSIEDDDSTAANLELINVPIGVLRAGDFFPVALVSRFGRRIFRFYAVESRQDDGDLRPRIRLSQSNFHRIGASTEGWHLVFSPIETIHVNKAKVGEVGMSTSLRFNHRPRRLGTRGRGWVMVNSNYVSAPIRYESTGLKSLFKRGEKTGPKNSTEIDCRASFPLRIVLGLEPRSHFAPPEHSNIKANAGVVMGESGVNPHVVKKEFSEDKLRISAMTPWVPLLARMACYRLHRNRVLSILFWQICGFIRSIPEYLAIATRESLHLLVGGPEFLCRTIAGEPAIDGFGIIMTSEERLSMLGAEPPRSTVDARTCRRRISVTAISLGHGRVRISESGVKTSNSGKQTAAPVGPLAIPFILKLGLASRRQLQLPMNSAVYIRRNARGVLANGFFRLVLPIAGVVLATMSLASRGPGRVDVYGYEVSIWLLVPVISIALLVGILSLRVSNGKVR
jgi:hypothetical protein